jgi:hypothetical protein
MSQRGIGAPRTGEAGVKTTEVPAVSLGGTQGSQPMTAADGPAVAALFEAVYGGGYVDPSVYDPAEWRRRVGAGTTLGQVLRDAGGDIVAFCALEQSGHGAGSAEMCKAVAKPVARNMGIVTQLILDLFARAETDPSIDVVWGKAVACHAYIQRIALKVGFVNTGFMFDMAPAGTFAREGIAEAVSTIMHVRVVSERGRADAPLHCPHAYGPLLAYLAAATGVRRTVVPGCEAPSEPASEAADAAWPDLDRAGLDIRRVGADVDRVIADFDRHHDDRATREVAVARDDPAAPAAVAAARRAGYAFGAWMPCWMGADALVMQKTRLPVREDGVVLVEWTADGLFRAAEADRRFPAT